MSLLWPTSWKKHHATSHMFIFSTYVLVKFLTIMEVLIICWSGGFVLPQCHNLPEVHIIQELHLRLLKFMTVQTVATWLLQSCIWRNKKTSGQTRPKWRHLVIVHSATFGKTKHSISTKNHHCNHKTQVWEGWWFRLVLHPQDLGTLKPLSQSNTPLYTKVL